jgi:acetolactate synthase-1/2/3 large subunit
MATLPSPSSQIKATGGQILVDQLVANGVTQATCVPGESYLAVLDALRDAPIDLIVCRQEGGAAMMAEAHGKLTGKPGICFVTRGPGATNASAGVHIAMQDSTPMILFIGQVERAFRGREAFQEIDHTHFFAPICKWATEIDDAARLPEFINRAFHLATSGRPGPVVLSLPEDMLMEEALFEAALPTAQIEQSVDEGSVQEIEQRLGEAKSPLLLLGGSTWTKVGCEAITRFAENWQMPVAISFRRQHLFDHTHPNFAGHVGIAPDPALVQRIKQADVILMLGGRFSEIPSQGYTLLDVPKPRQFLIHIHPDSKELGRVYQPALAICARADEVAKKLSELPAPKNSIWRNAVHDAHEAYKKWIMPTCNLGRVQMADIILQAATLLPADAIIASGAGNFAGWVHRFYPFRKFNTQLAPTSGSMGYGLPAAIAAKALFPERQVICFAGDGDLMMTVQELATAVQHKLPIIVIIVDNGMYGTIRMHQEKTYPGRVYATDLKNPDFVPMAKSFGCAAFSVNETAAFAPALQQAMKSSVPSVIHVRLDPEAITPTKSLSVIREEAKRN